MPEYLSPDVYVEEIDTGSKPIEGVSTSTAGMLGVTERGPANVPILVTSYGEFTRWFGERLDPIDFPDHCFLPHAAEGFFTNGGKRLYLTRIEAQGAERAAFVLHDRGPDTASLTRLLRPAPEASGDPIYVLNVTSPVFPGHGPLVVNQTIRIGTGSETEYRVVAAIDPDIYHVPLSLPLYRAHVASAEIQAADVGPGPLPNTFQLDQPTPRGAVTIVLAALFGDVAEGDLLEVHAGPNPISQLAEFRFVVGQPVQSVGTIEVTLDAPLSLEHPAGVNVLKRAITAVPAELMATAAGANGTIAFLSTSAAADFSQRERIVILDPTDLARREARRIGVLAALYVEGAFADYPAGSVVTHVTFTLAGTPNQLTAAALGGSTAVAVNDRTQYAAGTVVQLGTAPLFEFATVATVPNSSAIAPNAGNLVFAHPLRNTYAVGTAVQPVTAPVLQADRPAAALLFDARRGETTLPVSDGGDGGVADEYLANDLVRITTSAGAVYYHALTASAVSCDAHAVTLGVLLERPHPVGSQVAERSPLLEVRALDTGIWGNRLRISVEDEAPGLVSRAGIVATVTQNRLRVSSLTGIESGTVLEVVDAVTGAQLGAPLKVQSVDRSTGEVTLDAPALDALQFATLLGAPPLSFLIRSREFHITVRLLRQPDPMLPSRNGTVLDREDFRYLSMDPRHSRYVETVLGDLAGPPRLSDRRPDGESWYVRVSDASPTNTVRLGPEPLIDVLPDGRIQPARHPLSHGDDSLITLSDATYIGEDDVNPEERTGLFTLANVEDVSIVACPGRTSAQMQTALITHCEQQRYRFAVLDAQSPPHDSIEDVTTQRQQFDTKYAALYHPWLLVAQPFPVSAAVPKEYAIPPSGHVAGVFARTDIERGVHKAPANEPVRGILGLTRTLNKEQHDVLNPYPTNINVIRDFRRDSRGIRVYGGRCITSDTDWKYVNVRRLLIFIEKSINVSLQWVVFEPNAEPLWARVRRAISNFLTLVWRNGALEGTKPEEAFFVKCDRTTMTQTDIDSGRLICIVGVAPVKPAEFVIVRIGLWTAHAED